MSGKNEIVVRLTHDQMEDVLSMSKFYHTVWQANGRVKLLASGWNFNSYSISGIDEESKTAIRLIFG